MSLPKLQNPASLVRLTLVTIYKINKDWSTSASNTEIFTRINQLEIPFTLKQAIAQTTLIFNDFVWVRTFAPNLRPRHLRQYMKCKIKKAKQDTPSFLKFM